jgi:hypothetical protein
MESHRPPRWISGTKYCTVSILTLTSNLETKGTDPTKATRGCYTDGFVATQRRQAGLKRLGGSLLPSLAHGSRASRSDKDGVRAGAGAIHL